MTNQLFEKAKQAVAVENGYSDWGQVLRICDYEEVYRMMEEVFEHGCNEAVKGAKGKVGDYIVYNRFEPSITLEKLLDSVPLPFPQQPDER